MRYRLTPRPELVVYCEMTPGLPQVEFLGVAWIDLSGAEDVRNVTLSEAEAAESWVAGLPVSVVRQACAA